jgi:serine protease
MLSVLTRSGLTRGRWAVGGFLAVAIGAALASAGMSAAGASTSVHTKFPVRTHVHIVPRPHGGAIQAAGSNLINHGGPVQTAPKVWVVYWGWTSDPKGEQARLQSFLTDVGGSSWLSTVHQYSSAGYTGDLLHGTWSDTATVPTHPTDAQIQAEAKKAATHFATGTSDNVEIVVATPTGHSESGFGTQWCAYHGAVSSDPSITYTYLPYMTDAGASCGENSVNAGSAGVLDGVSIVEGHELAETITDPLLNAWYDSSGSEIGDKCAWINLQNTSMGGGSFPTQPLWSNSTRGCVQ